jgi:hypothetical protein
VSASTHTLLRLLRLVRLLLGLLGLLGPNGHALPPKRLLGETLGDLSLGLEGRWASGATQGFVGVVGVVVHGNCNFSSEIWRSKCAGSSVLIGVVCCGVEIESSRVMVSRWRVVVLSAKDDKKNELMKIVYIVAAFLKPLKLEYLEVAIQARLTHSAWRDKCFE